MTNGEIKSLEKILENGNEYCKNHMCSNCPFSEYDEEEDAYCCLNISLQIIINTYKEER